MLILRWNSSAAWCLFCSLSTTIRSRKCWRKWRKLCPKASGGKLKNSEMTWTSRWTAWPRSWARRKITWHEVEEVTVLKIVSRNSTVQLLEAISKDWQCSEIFISLFTLEISRQTCRVRCLIISFFILGILSSFFFLSPFSPYVKWECRRGSLPGTIKFQVESRGDEVATSSSWTGGGGGGVLTF